jgi:hypothetical protein
VGVWCGPLGDLQFRPPTLLRILQFRGHRNDKVRPSDHLIQKIVSITLEMGIFTHLFSELFRLANYLNCFTVWLAHCFCCFVQIMCYRHTSGDRYMFKSYLVFHLSVIQTPFHI